MSDDVEHTPGPWKVDGQVAGTYFVAGQVEDGRPGGEVVAEVDSTVASLEVPNGANARLIAAAPDLLEGLNKAYDELYKIDHLTEAEVPQSLMQDLQDILAKAEGRNE